MNRLTNRIVAASAGLAACGLILTGCGSGQISQTADQQAAVNGMSANVKNISLRNVHLQASQTGDFLQPGRIVPLLFVAANSSPDVSDKLVSITSDNGSVALTGETTVPANGALVVGSKGQAEPMGDAAAPAAAVTLSKAITNGLAYNFTFNFEKAGTVTVAVPVAAGEAAS
ncbi:MAG: hypothetical protein ACR2JM_17000 [Mycobacterium sp.]